MSKIVGYVRLSRDDKKVNYTSITAQKELIREYAKEHNLKLDKIYEDDNVSGYLFDRPEFNEMVKEIDEGNISFVLTKDFSRIGRKNSLILNFIDELRDNDVGIIFINEKTGGFNTLVDEDDTLGIKTWSNEWHVKEASKKIRDQFSKRQKNGTLVIGNIYGYIKEKKNNKFYFYIDEEIRPVIELIFKLYLSGEGYIRICNILNEKGYPTPSVYEKQRLEKKGEIFRNKISTVWRAAMVYRIIKNDFYIGTLTTHKHHAKRIKGKTQPVPIEQQYKFPDNHEAIISEENFVLAQEIKAKRNNSSYRNNSKYDYIFSSFIKCVDCGYKVSGYRIKNSEKTPGYNCTSYMTYGKKRCTNRLIREDELLFYFKRFLSDLKEDYEAYIATVKLKQKNDNIIERLKNLEKKLENKKSAWRQVIIQKSKALANETDEETLKLTQETYEQVETEHKEDVKKLTVQLDELRSENVNKIEDKVKTTIQLFDDIIKADRPDRKHLEMILDKILLDSERNLTISLKINIENLIK